MAAEYDPIEQVTKTFFVPEPDLAILERSLAVLHDCASTSPSYFNPEVQVSIEELKRIVSDIRWSYGPFSYVKIIPASDP